MPKLLFQDHGSCRLTADDERVVYIDPYKGEGYDAPADAILVTHQHPDHNQTMLCAKKPHCKIITNVEALEGGKHQSFDIDGIKIRAVEAMNENHNPHECVGFIVEMDGKKIYFAGDTSRTGQMESFAKFELDYALFPGDGVYNMDITGAAECAWLVGAKHNIVIHLNAEGEKFRSMAQEWTAPNKLIMEAGDEITL